MQKMRHISGSEIVVIIIDRPASTQVAPNNMECASAADRQIDVRIDDIGPGPADLSGGVVERLKLLVSKSSTRAVRGFTDDIDYFATGDDMRQARADGNWNRASYIASRVDARDIEAIKERAIGDFLSAESYVGGTTGCNGDIGVLVAIESGLEGDEVGEILRAAEKEFGVDKATMVGGAALRPDDVLPTSRVNRNGDSGGIVSNVIGEQVEVRGKGIVDTASAWQQSKESEQGNQKAFHDQHPKLESGGKAAEIVSLEVELII
jgi:hypothetical protein